MKKIFVNLLPVSFLFFQINNVSAWKSDSVYVKLTLGPTFIGSDKSSQNLFSSENTSLSLEKAEKINHKSKMLLIGEIASGYAINQFLGIGVLVGRLSGVLEKVDFKITKLVPKSKDIPENFKFYNTIQKPRLNVQGFYVLGNTIARMPFINNFALVANVGFGSSFIKEKVSLGIDSDDPNIENDDKKTKQARTKLKSNLIWRFGIGFEYSIIEEFAVGIECSYTHLGNFKEIKMKNHKINRHTIRALDFRITTTFNF